MAETQNGEKLFGEFPSTSSQEWMDKITKDLKGADYERKLVWRTMEGFKVQPYYRIEDLENIPHIGNLPGEYPFISGNKKDNNNWLVRQDIQVEDFGKANEKALDILMKGIESLGFSFKKCSEIPEKDFDLLLKGIAIDCIEINFNDSCVAHDVVKLLKNRIEKDNLAKDQVKAFVNFDPLGKLVLKGRFSKSAEDSFSKAKTLIEETKDFSEFRTIGVSGYEFHNAGSTIVQELAYSLATGSEYIYQLTCLGLSVQDVISKIKFNFAVGSNYFMEIAKFRAARMLWARIVETFDPEVRKNSKMHTHAVNSRWNKTVYDPYVNMLRTQTETMSAAIGGVDSITVESFNAVFDEPTIFSERIARNQQLLLKEESYFDKIVDPGAGSYYIEKLTDSIASEAWEIFQSIEEEGGFIEAFKKGIIQKTIKETVQKRDFNIATRKEIFLGTNQFPNFGEQIKVDEAIYLPKNVQSDDAIAEPLTIYRGAMAFEALRATTDKSSTRPKAYMLPMGNLAMRKARAQFSCNFFACAGFEVQDHNGFTKVEEGVQAMKDAKADIVVICSSDDEYADIAPEVHEKLKDNAIIVVAGAPKCMDELKTKGIENFIHVKTNVLEELKRYQSLVLK